MYLGTVTWAVGNNASLVSHTDSSAVIRGALETSQFCGMMTSVDATLNVAGKMHHLSKTIDSVWKPGFYVDKNHIWGSNGTYRVRHLGGEYGYVWSSNNPAWQIINYNSDIVAVSEGYTDYPVSLIATFYDPLGEQITVMERVH